MADEFNNIFFQGDEVLVTTVGGNAYRGVINGIASCGFINNYIVKQIDYVPGFKEWSHLVWPASHLKLINSKGAENHEELS